MTNHSGEPRGHRRGAADGWLRRDYDASDRSRDVISRGAQQAASPIVSGKGAAAALVSNLPVFVLGGCGGDRLQRG